uniref:ZP domain-containing protein n=1 Tax=Panagrolaimus davidi TaxID=227884 RepID=A0A914QBD2_9BILA
MDIKILFYFLCLTFTTFVEGFIENYVVGTPKVICAENDVALDVLTSKPFQGNIFVKGRAKDAPCRQSYSANGTNSYSLPLGKCGMQRLRSANPRGISFSVTVIVSFHPAGFITKNDRAYHIKCFYMEPDEIVTSGIEVSQIPTQELQDSMAMPKCEYFVRSGSPTGSPSTAASVGEVVYHVWECTGTGMGMLVRKCFVTDGDGEDHAVVDQIGCTADSFLLSDIEYEKDLMRAYATSQVFKYADSNQLFFTCQIRLCQKQMGMCDDVTPPKCGPDSTTPTEVTVSSNKTSLFDDETPSSNSTTATSRPRRSLPLPSFRGRRDIEIDVATPEMLVLDRDENEKLPTKSSEFCISKIFFPLFPLILLTVACLSSSLTLLCFKNYCSVPKIVEF